VYLLKLGRNEGWYRRRRGLIGSPMTFMLSQVVGEILL